MSKSIVTSKTSKTGKPYNCLIIKGHDNDQWPLFIGAQEALRIKAAFVAHDPGKVLNVLTKFGETGSAKIGDGLKVFLEATEQYGTLLGFRVDGEDRRAFKKGKANIAKLAAFVAKVGLKVFLAGLDEVIGDAEPMQFSPRKGKGKGGAESAPKGKAEAAAKPRGKGKGGRGASDVELDDAPAVIETLPKDKPAPATDPEIAALLEALKAVQAIVTGIGAKIDTLEAKARKAG